jgi:universal stress protein E
VSFLPLPDGPLPECILAHVAERRPDLLIKRPSGRHPLRRWTFDENDWGLVAACPVPVLLCRPRAWIQPMRIAALVDVSRRENEIAGRGILQAAGFLSLGARSHLEILYSERELHDETIRMARAVRLAALVREFQVGSQRMQILSGPPAGTLPDVLALRRHDVVVLGVAIRRGDPLGALRSLTSRLVDSTDSDVMLVKAPGVAEPASAGQQVLDEAEEFA